MTRINSQIKVLIAERALSVADLIARNLKAQGYAIAGIVNSAEKAIEFATITVPDIVLLDLPIPGQMDVFTAGWKILSEIQCPVVYMTTQERDVLTPALSLNPYGFLLKPFTAEELKTTIDQTLEHHRFRHGDRPTQRPELNTEPNTILDQCLFSIFATASRMTPMPRILFSGDRLLIYSSSPKEAATLQEVCQQCIVPLSYQILAWNWERGEYQVYAQEL
ncbi:MAG: response regulator [Leptolyngbyaceae cyanobacterium bins.349]|nr:response regulator [Leptolyngbyaceae cyanobacterium bins.349]